jgi:hypothetical protein
MRNELRVGMLVATDTPFSQRIGRIAEIGKTHSGMTSYHLDDGGMFSASELRPVGLPWTCQPNLIDPNHPSQRRSDR